LLAKSLIHSRLLSSPLRSFITPLPSPNPRNTRTETSEHLLLSILEETPRNDTVTMSTEKPLPFIYQFAAGAVAGVSEILVMYPLDVVKTRV
jgi:solute carrier family 25 2-oxodicarboxylate transporter 21